MVKSVLTRTVPVRQARAMQSNAPQGYYAASAGPASAAVSLRGDAKADVCIIGAGYTGLSAALHLATAGANVIVIEAESIGFGASGRNGGQIHPGHRKSQAELEHWLGVGHARDLWKLSEEARNLVFELASQDCELKRGLVIAVHNERAARELTQDTEYLSSHYGYTESRMLDRMQVQAAVGTDLYPAARMDGGGGHVHPLKYARKLAARAVAAGATIYVRSPALRIDRQTQLVVHGSQFKVVTDHIVLACDAFSTRLAPELSPYIAHVESFIVATEPLDPDHAAHIIPSDAAVADTRHVLDYYRKSSDRRLLFAGREAYWTPPDDVAGIVRPRMLKVFPSLQNVAIEFGWSGTVGITRTRMPHFGTLSPRLYFAHGYSGHGVALATLGGKALAEKVLGNGDRFETLARVPAQKFPGGQLLRKPMVTAALLCLKLADAF
ncbi:MAG TPA: FAD-binding oxidoreductase [Rhizomicrobium sp.]|jgi:gamma-glutamylputrescine oxidase